MRAKLLIAVLLLAAALLGTVLWLNGGFRSKTPSTVTDYSPAKSMSASSANPEPKAASLSPPESEAPLTNTAPANGQTSEEELRAQKVRQRIAELNDLAMNSDTNSLNTILSELNNSDKEIRKGALEAVIQFADRAAIPRLQEIADRTQDTTEKAALLEAIEYLKLPSLTEYLKEKGKSR